VITTALLAFFSIFVVGFLWGGFHPPMRTMVITWGVILGGGMIAGLWHGYWTLSGKYDLVIDEMHGLIELPATQGRKTRCRIPLKDVQAVRVDTVAQPSEQGEQSAVKHAPTLILHGVPPSSERLVQWFNKEKAERFAEWLRTKLQSS
jgi:hypothetical protein